MSPLAGHRERPLPLDQFAVRKILSGDKTQLRRLVTAPGLPCTSDADWAEQIRRTSPCPFGRTGENLWVRETWARREDGSVYYDADYEFREYRCRSALHMPRDAARLVLEVVELRVQRLQAISEADACAEGMGSPITRDCKVPKFSRDWERRHGAGSWQANPWVWAISFRRIL